MANSLLLFIALLLIILVLIYVYLSWNLNYWKRLDVPGPKPKILYGNFPSVLDGKQHIAYEFEEVYYKFKKSCRAIGVFVTRSPEILVVDPKLAHEIMVTNFAKFRDNIANKWIIHKKRDKFVSRNPFFTVVEQWKSRRADVLSGLTINKLTLAFPIWKATSEKLSQYLKCKSKDKGSAIIETKNLSLRFTAAVMGDFLWGIESNTLNTEVDDASPNVFLQNSAYMLQHSLNSVILFYFLSVVPFLRRIFIKRFFPVETDEFFSKLTHDAVALRLKDQTNRSRADFLNHVLHLQDSKGQTHDDLVGHLLTALLDGYETSGNVIAHVMFYLAKYESAQDHLRAEILKNLEADGTMNIERLNTLPYLEQCIYETMRLTTPIPTFTRINLDPTTLEFEPGKEVTIPGGTVINIPVFAFHHDPEFFPEPWKYKPERFDNGAHLEMTKNGMLLAFGDGPRICVGMRLGLLQVKSFLVQVLKEYRVKCCAQTLPEKKPDSSTFIFGLEGDIWLEYERLEP